MLLVTGGLSPLCLLFSLLWSTGNGILCEDQSTCRECITTIDTKSPCQWCADEGARTGSRCQVNFNDCENVLNPNSTLDDSMRDPKSPVEPIQYTISLRPGDPQSLLINVTTVREVPLDLYILFDLSTSLEDEFNATRTVSTQILNNLRNITNDVKVGFGAFIDKTIRPYSRRSLDNECVADERKIVICYNFRHYGPLTADADELSSRIRSDQLAPNIDAPEAGLDALAQIALCADNVGWRDGSVKIVLYFSDDAFHFAGEGRYAGIMKPYEEVCKLEGNLTADGFEEYSGLENDYTSPGEVLRLLQLSNIVPVFVAVSSPTQAFGFYNVLGTHQALADLFNIRLAGAASAAELDSSDQTMVAENVLRIIDRQVLNILQRTRLAPADIDGLSFTVEADCPPGANDAGASCTDVGVGNTTVFNLTLTLDDCTTFGTEPRDLAVNVFPVGSMVVQINPICECDCDDKEINSERCNFNGNYSCGECICNPGYCGFQCQIKVESDQFECPTGLGGEACSGTARGTCQTCECVCETNVTGEITDIRLSRPGVNPGTYGAACECDFYTCLTLGDSADTVVCSGRGRCCNGACICDTKEGYFYRSDNEDKRDCDCEPAELICRQPGTEKICGGRGKCGCQECECNGPYSGDYCENVNFKCTTLATSEIETCILDEKGRRESDKCQICAFSAVTVLNISCVVLIPVNEQPTGTNKTDVQREIEEFASKTFPGNEYMFELQCLFLDDDQCTHEYYILSNKKNISEIIFVAEEQRSCPSTKSDPLLPIPLWALAVILLVILLIVGVIILIIIKVIFMLLDYFEVKRLEKEVGLADFSKNQNPLYQSPDVEYKNVAYGKE